jgi:hypothetical protein
MSQTYDELVQRAKEAVQQANTQIWVLADLTAKAVPKMHGAQNLQFQTKMRRWILDIGWEGSPRTLQQYKYVSDAWPKSKRKKASFNVHHILAGNPDRFRLIHDGMTRSEAYRAVGRAEPSRTRADMLFVNVETGLRRAEAVLSFARSMAKCDWSNVTDEQLERYGEFRAKLDALLEEVDNLAGMTDNMATV